MDAPTVLKVQIYGVANTNSGRFLHQTKANQSLENILKDIFSGNNPCITAGKILELTGNDSSNGCLVSQCSSAEFGSMNEDAVTQVMDSVKASAKVKLSNVTEWR